MRTTGAPTAETAHMWRYDASNLAAVVDAGTVALGGASQVSVPAWSATLVVASAFHVFLPIGFRQPR